jgi:hypothetical protein
MSEHYILEGQEVKPVDLMTWASWFEKNRTNRHVGNDTVGDVRVSTVFLGLDHSFGEGPPMLFETMIFGGEHDEDQWHYSTWAEAEAGHARALALVKSVPSEGSV